MGKSGMRCFALWENFSGNPRNWTPPIPPPLRISTGPGQPKGDFIYEAKKLEEAPNSSLIISYMKTMKTAGISGE